MTDARHTADESDLAYLRRMADAGRGEPAPFLLLMAAFGGAYGLFALTTSLLILLETSGGREPNRGAASQVVGNWGFLLASLVFVAAAVWTLWRTFGPRRIAVSRVGSAVWSSAFIGVIALIAAITASAGNAYPMLRAEAAPSVLLIFWGCAWWVTAIASDRRWLIGVALGSFVGAVVLPLTVQTLWGLPLLAACLLLLAFMPAVLLMREKKR